MTEETQRQALEQRWPCLPNERHTFPSEDTACLCGDLWRGNVTLYPEVTLYTPNPNYYNPSEDDD